MPEGKSKVKVYSTPTCPYCKMAKEFLKKNNVDFEDINVASDKEKAKEMVDISGQMGVPVIVANGKLIVGFDKEQLKKTLNIKE